MTENKVNLGRLKDFTCSAHAPTRIFLKPWEECVGFYRGLRTSKNEIAIVLSLTNGQTIEIPFHRASVEEGNVLRELRDDVIGRKIGIMKVDDGKNTILTRTLVPEPEVHQYRARGENR